MKVREHFLLGTDKATISSTAKSDCDRETLFRYTIEMVLARYQQEFGTEALKNFIQDISSTEVNEVEWRLNPEDSCWSNFNKESQK